MGKPLMSGGKTQGAGAGLPSAAGRARSSELHNADGVACGDAGPLSRVAEDRALVSPFHTLCKCKDCNVTAAHPVLPQSYHLALPASAYSNYGPRHFCFELRLAASARPLCTRRGGLEGQGLDPLVNPQPKPDQGCSITTASQAGGLQGTGPAPGLRGSLVRSGSSGPRWEVTFRHPCAVFLSYSPPGIPRITHKGTQVLISGFASRGPPPTLRQWLPSAYSHLGA